ncbi:hypothetical protein GGTG_05532 [Gaeumannomyces tritici R3-111a-1]|uniref:Uncharacterized protein n=1 Tax=Gaeumannomyces tritici (strain R3-111a-1) TaxID=644352 RepID=J3NW67_GAET3|nr:hypothetical protein GGTG_05532 [Gaeumannomyces tritici R3-111a-1]EJT75599.1 hypothetical protein GGTG_05532 [Gaeumannomyces tritici R3-111a-1]
MTTSASSGQQGVKAVKSKESKESEDKKKSSAAPKPETAEQKKEAADKKQHTSDDKKHAADVKKNADREKKTVKAGEVKKTAGEKKEQHKPSTTATRPGGGGKPMRPRAILVDEAATAEPAHLLHMTIPNRRRAAAVKARSPHALSERRHAPHVKQTVMLRPVGAVEDN